MACNIVSTLGTFLVTTAGGEYPEKRHVYLVSNRRHCQRDRRHRFDVCCGADPKSLHGASAAAHAVANFHPISEPRADSETNPQTIARPHSRAHARPHAREHADPAAEPQPHARAHPAPQQQSHRSRLRRSELYGARVAFRHLFWADVLLPDGEMRESSSRRRP